MVDLGFTHLQPASSRVCDCLEMTLTCIEQMSAVINIQSSTADVLLDTFSARFSLHATFRTPPKGGRDACRLPRKPLKQLKSLESIKTLAAKKRKGR